MTRRICALFAVLTWSISFSAAESLVTAVSHAELAIRSNFTGTEVAVFGTIERDIATVARSGEYHVVVLVKGPRERVDARKKGQFFGAWINRQSIRFARVPSYYVAASSHPIAEIAAMNALQQYQIGLDNLTFAAVRPVDDPDSPLPGEVEFGQSIVRLKAERGLYSELPGAVRFLSDRLFAVNIPLPANVTTGPYQTEVYLFREGVLLASSQNELAIEKSGTNAIIADAARNQSVLYGLLSLAMAVFTGWIAGFIFRRD